MKSTVNPHMEYEISRQAPEKTCPVSGKSLFFKSGTLANKTEFLKSGGLTMPRRLTIAFFLVLFIAAYVPPAETADGVNGLILGGSDESPVKLEVFSDFECPYCSYLFFNAIQPVLKNYKDKVCVIYYEFPLNMHQYARPASRYVSAAARLGDQKKILMLFDTIFAEQDEWARNGNLEASVSKALSPDDFKIVKEIMETERESIEQDIDRSVQLGLKRAITGTPTLFLTYAGKQERVVMPSNIKDIYLLLSWRLNGLLGQQK